MKQNRFTKYIFAILLVLITAFSAYADSAKQVDFLLAGYRTPASDKVLSGGKVWTFLDGTTTMSALWTDKDKGGFATNPVILDSSGKIEIYGDNIYKFRIYDSEDIFIEEISGLEYLSVIVEEIETIALLRLKNGTFPNEPIRVLGWHSAGDGGGGPIRLWKTGETAGTYIDTGGDVIVPTGGDGSEAWVWSESYRATPEEFGAVGDGITPDGPAITAVFAYGLPLFNYGKTYNMNASITAEYTGDTEIDFNGCIFDISILENSTFLFRISNGTLKVSNVWIKCNRLTHRPIICESNSADANIYVKNVKLWDVKRVAGLTGDAIGLLLSGGTTGGTVGNVDNISIYSLDSEVGLGSTTGVQVGFGGQASFVTGSVTNAYFTEITEQEGTTLGDSDCVKIFGFSGTNPVVHSSAYVRDITVDNRFNLKRVVKTQTDSFDISNITMDLQSNTMFTIVGAQYGFGTIKNIYGNLTDTATLSIAVTGPAGQLVNQNQNGPVDIGNIIIVGDGTCLVDTTIWALDDVDLTVVRRSWNIHDIIIDNCTLGDSFAVIGASNNNTAYTFKNIDCTTSTQPLRAFSLGRATVGISDFFSMANFENVNMAEPLVLNGPYAGSAVIYTNLIPIEAINSNLIFKQLNVGGSKASLSNGMYRFDAGNLFIGAIGSTILKLSDWDANQFLSFKCMTGVTSTTAESNFTLQYNGVSFNYDPIFLDERHTNVAILMETPTTTWDEPSKTLTVNFSGTATAKVAQMEITSSRYFDVSQVYGRTML